MPTHVSIASAIDKAKLASDVVYLTLLEVDVLDRATNAVVQTLRYAHNNESYTFMGNTYTPCGFNFRITQGKGEMPNVTLEVSDITQALQGLLQQYEGGVDFPVRIIVVSTANTTSPELTESFTIISANTNSADYTISLELGAENPLGLRFPWRVMKRNRCSWRYRSTECGYDGPLASCDFTINGPNGCRAHDNADNFGGFPGIRAQGNAL